MAEIKSMFHQVKVPVEDRDCLRFYWWKDGNYHLKPDVFRMTVHLFGAVSSPSCAASALLKTAEDNENLFSKDAIEIIRRNFYVDDCLKSVDSPERAVTLVDDLTRLCQRGGFKLTKWISNDRNVLETISVEEIAKDLVELDLDYGKLPIEHALGVSCQ
ncbi:hypothetical protein SNE40_002986 [Patella caerulea]|uniref:Uncharacterized protein n=1 Tax=Patella caerulea TaxID=87958 RepID=A0AAN8K6X7_PATCE